MSSFDTVLLIGCVIAVCLVFVLPRPAIFGPLIVAWIGAGIAVYIAYVEFYESNDDRIDIRKSLPLMIAGLIGGGVLGCGVQGLYTLNQSSRFWIEVIGVTLLFGSVGAVAGAFHERRNVEGISFSNVVPLIAETSALGFICGILQWHRDGRAKRPIEQGDLRG